MEISGKTKLMGLIGNPVEHTLSPVIHNTIAETMNESMVYVAFPVADDIESAVKGAYALGIQGMNITVPYKSDAIPFLADLDKEAEIIGAVNTLVRTENGYKGYNTDLPGLYRAILSEGIEVKGSRVIIVGAGGAARAAAFMCAFNGAERVVILNRTVEKAERIAEEVKDKTGFTAIEVKSISDYNSIEGEGYLVLQATKVGLYPKTEESPITDEAFFKKAAVVYDLIYTPQQTMFMQLAAKQGVAAYNGLKMLLYQGVSAYEMWNQVSVPEEVVEKAYKALLDKI
jgi:shikimate dehydrogenase